MLSFDFLLFLLDRCLVHCAQVIFHLVVCLEGLGKRGWQKLLKKKEKKKWRIKNTLMWSISSYYGWVFMVGFYEKKSIIISTTKRWNKKQQWQRITRLDWCWCRYLRRCWWSSRRKSSSPPRTPASKVSSLWPLVLGCVLRTAGSLIIWNYSDPLLRTTQLLRSASMH